MTKFSEPRTCRDDGCDEQIILARRPHPNQDKYGAYEAQDREPFSDLAVGAHVILAGQAWRPLDLIEDFRVRFECPEDRARALVEGHPWHRPHHHAPRDHKEDGR